MAARTAADGEWVRRTAWTAADGVGATEWLEMGGEEAAGDQRAWLGGWLRTAWVRQSGWKWVEKKPLVMSELGCADSCGRQMDGKNCADGVGAGEGREKKPLGMGELGCADGCGRQMGAENIGELRGRLRTAWVPGSG